MPKKKNMYYVGFCRICGTGPLGLRECGGCGAVVVLCDECDAVWLNCDSNAGFSAKPHFANEDELPCPHCEASLVEAPSRWARKAKINNTSWVQEALAKGQIELKRGSAMAPEIDEQEETER